MSMVTNTLGRYFAGRFVVSALGVFASILVLLVLVDYIEMVRKTSGLVSASAITVAETSLFRVPQLLEKMMPFCILIGAMTCYLALSRRLELVVARAASPGAVLALVPLLGLLALFGHERRRRLEGLLELGSAYRGTALVLGDVVEADDGYTGEHCRSVVSLALEVAAVLKLDAQRLRNLEFGALLHDVGKIAIPKEIINKPGKLDAAALVDAEALVKAGVLRRAKDGVRLLGSGAIKTKVAF